MKLPCVLGPTAQSRMTSDHDLAIDRGERHPAFSPPVGIKGLSVPWHTAHLPGCPSYSAIERHQRDIQTSDRNDRHTNREVDTGSYRSLVVMRDIRDYRVDDFHWQVRQRVRKHPPYCPSRRSKTTNENVLTGDLSLFQAEKIWK